MKKLALVLILGISMVLPNISMAGDVFTPPKDIQSLIGKVITFADIKGTEDLGFCCAHITGAVWNKVEYTERVYVYVSGVKYCGFNVERLIYADSCFGRVWLLDYRTAEDTGEHIMEIKILSIK